MVGGKVKKLPDFFGVPNELKSTKNNMFFSTFGSWVGGLVASVEFSTLFFEPFP